MSTSVHCKVRFLFCFATAWGHVYFVADTHHALSVCDAGEQTTLFNELFPSVPESLVPNSPAQYKECLRNSFKLHSLEKDPQVQAQRLDQVCGMSQHNQLLNGTQFQGAALHRLPQIFNLSPPALHSTTYTTQPYRVFPEILSHG